MNQTTATFRRTTLLRSLFIFLYSVYVTLRISILYIIYSYRYTDLALRQRGNTLLHWWAKRLLDAIQFKFNVTNAHYLQLDPKRRYIIMSNHCSFYDIPLVILAAPDATIRMITKKELFRIPIWGRALKMSEFLPLDRRNRRLAFEQLQQAKEKMQGGLTIWISPEGTRSKDGHLMPFKRGGFKLAKETDAIIIPIFLKNTHRIVDNPLRYCVNLQSNLHVSPPIDTRDYSNIDAINAQTYDALMQSWHLAYQTETTAS